jgi:hypothetical protein
MIEIGVSGRRPWLGRSFAKAGNRGERRDGDHEEEEGKWRRSDKWLGLMTGSLFIRDSNEGHATVY